MESKLVFIVWLLGLAFAVSRSPSDDLDSVIEDLRKSIVNSQIQESGKQIGQVVQKGVYPCYIHNNFVRSWQAEILRQEIAVFDNNAFVTAWVTILTLEAASVKNGPAPTDEQLSLALEALGTYHDRNSPEGDGSMVFWPQSYNSSVQQWYCDPVNVDTLANDVDKMMDFLHKVLDGLHLEKIWNSTFEIVQKTLENEVVAFLIPPDFDDTLVNIGLGSMLSTYTANPASFKHWKTNNTNFTHAFQALKKYAYRPFSSSENSVIDPRTYFYMREYLHSIQNRNAPAAFVTTWLHLVSEEEKTRFSFSMPFHVNNVDLTVSANVLYGITTTLLSKIANPEEWFDQDVEMIYENTTNLIAWMVAHNFSGRPDLALTYYPSVYNFYWFTSRILYILETYTASGAALPYSVLTRTMSTLSVVLRGNVTSDLLKRAKTEQDGSIYFEDFLGNDDRDITGKPVERGEDRLCSTAMAVNTLLYTWMSGGHLLDHTPSKVKEVISNASLWLLRNANKAAAYNVVFSGSVKADSALPFFFPENYMLFLNGSAVPPGYPIGDPLVVAAIRGVVPEDQYQEMLKQEHFGVKTQVDFYGYNQDTFPYWSAKPFTYGATMLALTKYRALVASGQLSHDTDPQITDHLRR